MCTEEKEQFAMRQLRTMISRSKQSRACALEKMRRSDRHFCREVEWIEQAYIDSTLARIAQQTLNDALLDGSGGLLRVLLRKLQDTERRLLADQLRANNTSPFHRAAENVERTALASFAQRFRWVGLFDYPEAPALPMAEGEEG